MFGKKKKLAQQAEQERLAQEQALQEQPTEQQEPVFFDSEIIDDNEILPAELWEELETEAQNAQVSEEEAAQLQAIENAFEGTDEPQEELEEVVEEEEQTEQIEEIEEVEEPAQQESTGEEEEEETVYIVDGPEEDDEIVEPSKFVKLPHLIDFILKQNYSKAMLLKMTTMIMGVYKRPSNTTEDKQIIKRCLLKLAVELQKK